MHSTALAPLQDQRLAPADEWQVAAPGPRCATPIIVSPCAAPTAAPAAVRARTAAPRSRGFTLIELMIAVSIAGILSSVALPSFEGQLQRARRADALVAMTQLQAAQERFRNNGTSYGSLAEIGVPGVTPAKHYTLASNAVGNDGYEALATATGTQARDAACRYLKLSSAGMNLVYASGRDATVGNAADANRKCWNL